ncbi:hypothetical protein CKM354_000965800 [Cercospora kikuchii]|uniref:Uncharacterized protein n=1 Tax=Cercospora kikuchii TaxID=84275 RepID=A0A9P3CPF9_9PEZI|nr:uncharacterized protein CKM354_000965800 [Cercospora kikuchii]GIZ46534.1 hypothetical protein CKM354_000965800 [Cercospora kikuchii]
MPAFSLLSAPRADGAAETSAQPPRVAAALDSSRQTKADTSTAAQSNKRKRNTSESGPARPPTPPLTPSPNVETSTFSAETSLSMLDDIITSELSYWAHYMSAAATQTSYSEITSNETTTETKIAALRHVLETLPLRYQALATAYSDTHSESVEIPENLQTLLQNLAEDPTEVELEGWYDQKWLQRKKFRSDIMSMDGEVRRLEEARMQELKALMLMVEEMKLAAADGSVDDEALTHLIHAADEVGLGLVTQRKSRAASEESWTPGK